MSGATILLVVLSLIMGGTAVVAAFMVTSYVAAVGGRKPGMQWALASMANRWSRVQGITSLGGAILSIGASAAVGSMTLVTTVALTVSATMFILWLAVTAFLEV